MISISQGDVAKCDALIWLVGLEILVKLIVNHSEQDRSTNWSAKKTNC